MQGGAELRVNLCGEAVGVELDAEPCVFRAVLGEDIAQVPGGIGAGKIGPLPDVLDDRGLAGDEDVRPAGEEGQRAVRAEEEALEEAVAEGVYPVR